MNNSSKTPTKVGFFGGSFNPPHWGHILASLYALKQYKLDQVWWCPVFKHAFNKDLLSFEHRMNMCKLSLTQMSDAFSVHSIEKDLQSEGKSLLVLRELRLRHPKHQFFLMIGSDTLSHTSKWYQFKTLQEEFPLLTIPRESYTEGSFSIPNISSTQIRRYIGEEKSFSNWVCPQVTEYIKQHQLY